jgi:flagellar basal body L-ring protein FlgH
MFSLIVSFLAGVLVTVLVPKVFSYGVYVVSTAKELLAKFKA